MSYYLGIDTSNYTTSVSLFNSAANEIIMQKKLLPVQKNSVGLRQSDAVFAHIKQIPELFEAVFDKKYSIKAVCVSSRPRGVEGSYMPVFLVGTAIASCISSLLCIPMYTCSHQEGHIVSALYSSGRMDLIKKQFLAFHISGGTTECMLISQSGSSDTLFDVKPVAKTLDLNAGQLIDRVGVMLSLQFPCGKELTDLALTFTHSDIKVKPTMKGLDVHLSGVQNKCEDMFKKGEPPNKIARYTIEYIKYAVERMTLGAIEAYGELPIVYAGGVMSNIIIKDYIENRYDAYFAEPRYSTDNAAGASIIANLKDKEN